MTFNFAQDADSRVNKHLQKTYQQQEFMRQRTEIMSDDLEKAPALKNYPKEEGTYGVIKEAPEEALPDFSRPSKTYVPNPLESTSEAVQKRKDLRRYEDNLQREYKRQYIRNAEKDNVKVNINDDNVVDDYRQESRPKSNPMRSGNGQN